MATSCPLRSHLHTSAPSTPAPVANFRPRDGGAASGGNPRGAAAKKEKKVKPPRKIAEGKAKDANVKLGDIKSLLAKIGASSSLPLGLNLINQCIYTYIERDQTCFKSCILLTPHFYI